MLHRSKRPNVRARQKLSPSGGRSTSTTGSCHQYRKSIGIKHSFLISWRRRANGSRLKRERCGVRSMSNKSGGGPGPRPIWHPPSDGGLNGNFGRASCGRLGPRVEDEFRGGVLCTLPAWIIGFESCMVRVRPVAVFSPPWRAACFSSQIKVLLLYESVGKKSNT
jgi:hypothetical protein